MTAPDLPLDYSARGSVPRQLGTLLHATCTPNTTYGLRRMVSGAQVRNQPYSDPARGAVSDMVTGVGTGVEVDHTVFGGVPGTQVFPAGDYADTITLRVYY
jgi:spore coat protein U-like protein